MRSGKAADYMMLPDVISREPLGPYVGRGSALKFAQGINPLWNQGGLMYPMPFR